MLTKNKKVVMDAKDIFPQPMPKMLSHYVTGHPLWLESLHLKKPKYENPECTGSVLMLVYERYEGDQGIDWQCWGCGHVTFDGRKTNRHVPSEEQEQIRLACKEYMDHLSPELELKLRRALDCRGDYKNEYYIAGIP